MIKNDNEFLLHGMRHYDNPSMTSIEEFKEDIKKFVYVLSLINRYKNEKTLSERLLLNHIIIIFNVFGNGAIDMFYYRIPKDLWPIIETYMFFIKRIDKVKTNIDFAVLASLNNL